MRYQDWRLMNEIDKHTLELYNDVCVRVAYTFTEDEDYIRNAYTIGVLKKFSKGVRHQE